MTLLQAYWLSVLVGIFTIPFLIWGFANLDSISHTLTRLHVFIGWVVALIPFVNTVAIAWVLIMAIVMIVVAGLVYTTMYISSRDIFTRFTDWLDKPLIRKKKEE